MIPRYTNPEMGAIWTDQAKYEAWYQVELAAMESMAELGIVPRKDFEVVKAATVKIDPAKIDEIEQVTRHDIIAFLTHVEEQTGESGRWIHFGMTSSDVLDTAFALQLKQASAIINDDLVKLAEVVKRRALEHKMTPMVGRSHGIHAEPITFGLVLALWYAEIQRHIKRFAEATASINVGQVSGAVGTFAHLPPEVEERTCRRLGLDVEPVSNQIIQRDRHAHYFSALAQIAGTIEKIALEIRHLQRTEVREAEEYFAGGQKGSSAMPHKRNPIGSENISGLARVIRSNSLAAFENVALWHERDISHSSVERVIAPDSTIALDYILRRLTRMLDKLSVFPENMLKNLEITRGLVFSQSVLLKLIRSGAPRQASYVMVQRNAMSVWQNQNEHLREKLLADEEVVGYLGVSGIEECFNLDEQLKNVDYIFKRVFG